MRVARPRRPRASRRSRRESLRRGIYIIPLLFTVGNMLCGFASVLYALHDQLERAGYLILIAGFLDGLDGRIARLQTPPRSSARSTTPSPTSSASGSPGNPRLPVGTARRRPVGMGRGVPVPRRGFGPPRPLQRQGQRRRRRFFTGLPIPGGAGALTLMVLVATTFDLVVDRPIAIVAAAFVLLVSLLMVSTCPTGRARSSTCGSAGRRPLSSRSRRWSRCSRSRPCRRSRSCSAPTWWRGPPSISPPPPPPTRPIKRRARIQETGANDATEDPDHP